MAITLNEIAYDLLNLIRAGRSVAGETISIDQIKFWVVNSRAQLIRNEANKQRTIDPELIQDLGCLELEAVDAALCCNVSVDCNVVRTKKKIPGFIEINQKPLVTRVGPINRTSPQYDFIPIERLPFEFQNKFTKNQIKSYIHGDYIYLAGHKDNPDVFALSYVNIAGVFEDPRSIADFECENEACYSDDGSFRIKRWMIEQMKAQILQLDLQTIAGSFTDKTSDSKLDLENQAQP